MCKAFLCEICNYETDIKAHFKRHCASKHSDIREFRCNHDSCAYATSDKYALKTHSLAHKDIRAFPCSVEGCGYAAKTHSNLLSHNMIIHSANTISYKCNHKDCLYETVQKSNLIRHERIHAGVKRLSCSSCEYKTDVKSHLDRHVRYHVGERKFQCDYPECSFSAVESNDLKKHKEIHSLKGQQRQKRKEEMVAKALTAAGISYKREHVIDVRCLASPSYYFRVDFLLVENGNVVIVEIDEHQHYSYPVSCDSVRPWKIAESLTLDGNTLPVLIIRWNPDAFTYDGAKMKVLMKDRYNALIETINNFVDRTDNKPLSLTYMYYDKVDNELSITLSPEFDSNTLQLLTL